MSVDINNPDPFVREEAKILARERLEDIRPNEHTYLPGENFEGTNNLDVTTAGYYVDALSKHPGAPQQIKQFYSPVVSSKHMPLIYNVNLFGMTAKVRASFMNNMMDFSSDDANARLKFSSGDPSTGSADTRSRSAVQDIKSKNTQSN